MATVEEVRARLVSRFPSDHAIFTHLNAGEFDQAADIVRAKYAYSHPLEETIRGFAPPPAAPVSRRGRRPDAPPEPEPEVVAEEPASESVVEEPVAD